MHGVVYNCYVTQNPGSCDLNDAEEYRETGRGSKVKTGELQ